jgi:hypothetical protein
VRLRRLAWFGSVLLAVALLLLAVQSLLDWNDERRDLARKATWTTSSNYPSGGCSSPEQVCVQGVNYFFHTGMEQNPSIVFDLGGRKGISRVVVGNRLDCCPERAVPLVVSVSDDQKTWREVARKTESFTTWQAKFPRVRARYVKLHVAGGAMILHLSRVRILPS